VAGQTRVNTVLLERETGTHTTICAEGLQVTSEDVAALGATVAGWLAAHARETPVVVFAGSWPAGARADAYVPLLRAARAAGAATILDASGAYLAAGIAAPPWALKPNREELESLAGHPVATPDAAVDAARDLLARGVTRVVASLGAGGAVAVEGEQAWVAEPLAVEACNPAGAGDAVVAAMALGAEGGWDLPRVLREAVAAATAVVVTPGTADCDVSRLAAFRQRVVVRMV
jgi:1-phosphofructokinase family hexose kinase